MSRLRDAWNGLLGKGPSTKLTRQIRREWIAIQLDIEQQLSQMHRLVQRLAQREKRATSTAVTPPPDAPQGELTLQPALNGRLALRARKAELRRRRSGLAEAPQLPLAQIIPEEEPDHEPIGQASEVSG